MLTNVEYLLAENKRLEEELLRVKALAVEALLLGLHHTASQINVDSRAVLASCLDHGDGVEVTLKYETVDEIPDSVRNLCDSFRKTTMFYSESVREYNITRPLYVLLQEASGWPPVPREGMH